MIKLLLVSHSPLLARATKDFCEKMLPHNKEVKIITVAGDDQNNFGNSLTKIKKELNNKQSFSKTAIIYDLGSAKIMLDLILNNNDDPNIVVIETPFVEGSFIAYASLNKQKPLAEIKKIIEQQIKK